MRRKVISSTSLLFLVLSTILSLSAIFSGIGTAKADSVIATIPVGTAPNEVAFDSANGDLYVANEHADSVSVISGQTNTVIGSPITVGTNPVGIAFDSANGDLYVTNINDRAANPSDTHCNTVCNTVSIISGESNTVIGNLVEIKRC